MSKILRSNAGANGPFMQVFLISEQEAPFSKVA